MLLFSLIRSDLLKLLNWSKLNKQSQNRNWTFIVRFVVPLCLCMFAGCVCVCVEWCAFFRCFVHSFVAHMLLLPSPTLLPAVADKHYYITLCFMRRLVCEHIYDFFIRNWVHEVIGKTKERERAGWNPVLEKIRHTSCICWFYCIRNDVPCMCVRAHLHLFCMFSLLMESAESASRKKRVRAYALRWDGGGEVLLLHQPPPVPHQVSRFNSIIQSSANDYLCQYKSKNQIKFLDERHQEERITLKSFFTKFPRRKNLSSFSNWMRCHLSFLSPLLLSFPFATAAHTRICARGRARVQTKLQSKSLNIINQTFFNLSHSIWTWCTQFIMKTC